MRKKEFVASYQGRKFSAPCQFFHETMRHLKEILESGTAKYLFPLDASYAHLAVPSELWGKKYSKLPGAEILPALLREPSLRALYHTADHLSAVDPHTGKMNPQAGARLEKQNVLASYDGGAMVILANVPRSPMLQGYETLATVHFLAHRAGALTFLVRSEPITIDISFDDDSAVEAVNAPESASYVHR